MERRAFRLNGFAVLLGLVVLAAVAAAAAFAGPAGAVAAIVLAVVVVLLATGFTVINPNEAKVVQFFGRYVGSVADAGFQWVLPLTTKRRVTLRVRNFETSKLKVNDAAGNPVEIAAVVVYKVVDSGKATFAVDDYEEYVAIQSEAAVRHLATTHPYDSDQTQGTSLRDGTEVAAELTAELRDRTDLAGVEVIEARITHLAYAPEIAQAMLVRQQAAQVVAARTMIVEGAVGMVGLALDRLREQGVVELDEERKANMVSNLLVVLCGDKATQPVVNAGSLYS
ncbi:regulator of protease activity HflC (stomatin/prohibitin superfamily) [Rhodococcus sp. PvR044]|uniref:SPFH domain-containing protein n=1 Tax=Rhodococcus oryzae TaxID=2571143 RepID=A0ABY2RGD9_9NOCA|nr:MULTISPECIES: SPFH domain-containing protein [Rhodococcus]MBP1159075.1 regulator of protease activity HflC (stomatin/prohibitin superfamily) [Rhodococcus sp. PvR099]PTR39052.1 regulator of protease activity HflC (stomatin/prohibitin superfamily) [Rhodococcus sp. OK611]TJZ74897.1 SPFH domain-containing protein [Rhodococcus oryzae]SNX92838.1 Regulator of protease activity HflC, stomatin/prohibitin superfamily [Rhodococcus sp. OK270]